MENKELGYFGENAVCNFLEEKGWTILERNFTIRGGEIDIIAEDGTYIAFVEVKTRKINSLVSGLEAVTKSKQKLIINAAEAYMFKSMSGLQPRFDVASVEVDNEKITDIIYIDNAFDASR